MSEHEGEYTYEIVEPKAPIVDKPSDVLRVGFRHSNTDRFVPYLTALVRGHIETGGARIQIPMGAVPGITLPSSMETKLREAAIAVMRGAVFYAELDADQFKKIWPFYTVIHDALADAIVIKLKREIKSTSRMLVGDVTIPVGCSTIEEDIEHLIAIRAHNHWFGKIIITGAHSIDMKERVMRRFPTCHFERTGHNETTIIV